MRTGVVVAAVSIAACRIPNETFSVSDGGSADAAHDGPAPATGFVYVVDRATGIYVLTHTATGELALAPSIDQPQTLAMGPFYAIANPAGTKLYVLAHDPSTSGPALQDYSIEADGSLTAGGSMPFPTTLPTPIPIRMTLSPNGTFIAIAIQTLEVGLAKLDATGGITSLTTTQFAMLMGSSTAIAFSPDSHCIYVTSGSGLVGASFSASGAITGTNSIAGPTNAQAVAVDPAQTAVYAAGGTTAVDIHSYGVMNCGFTSNVPATLAMTSTPDALLLDSANHRLYAPGKNIAVFDVAADSVTNGRSSLPQGGSAKTGGAALDDNGILYVAGPGYTDVTSGHTAVLAVTVDAGGVPTAIATADLPTAAQPLAVVVVPKR